MAEARVLAAPAAARGLEIASGLWGSLSTKASALGAFGVFSGRSQTGGGSIDAPSADGPSPAVLADQDTPDGGYPSLAAAPPPLRPDLAR